ncbi:MAG TPA: PHP domain-containing protein [Bacillota bacterium]|mgnify:CR=1 FL=1|nr:PHP domain-containing protein [Bacillota bacterium]
MIKVDLHLHTTASDGTWTNHILLQEVRRHKIEVFSITDHNTMENALKMKELCIDNGLTFIPGVEISCYYKLKEYHITTYGFDPGSAALQKLLAANQQSMEAYSRQVTAYICALTGAFSLEQYDRYENDRTRGGCKAINFLLDAGAIDRMEQFFEYAVESKAKPVLPEAHQVIETVKSAGGRPILAHPSVYHGGALMDEEELKEWINLGVMGLECFHPSADKAHSDFYTAFCRKNNLMVTGGSDCHGAFLPRRSIGHPEVTMDMLRADFLHQGP